MKKRTLLSGRKVRQSCHEWDMTISSKCPDKWLFVDLETGDIWHVRDGAEKQDATFWRRANVDELEEFSSVLKIALKNKLGMK